MPLALLAAALLSGCQEHPSGPPPIVLVSLDTFRADRLGVLGNPDGVTPNLDAFAAEGVLFEQAYSQAIQTAPSHTSLFTSRYPSEETGSDMDPWVPPDMPLLAQLLKLYGYQTAAFVGGADLSAARGLTPGFDTYEQGPEFGSLWHTTPMALRWLDARDTDHPYFLFVHGYDAHSPYLKPAPYGYAWADASGTGPGQEAIRTSTERIVDGRLYPGLWVLLHAFEERLRPRTPQGIAWTASTAAAEGEGVPVGPEDLALVRHVYDGGAAYADAQFGRLMAGLQARGVLDEAWVVVLSDHGEQLGEHGIFGHCCEAHDEETHVPLLVRAPKGAGGGRRVKGLVELVDVMPTVLELAGATPPAGIHGRSLLGAVRGEAFAGRAYAFTQGSEMIRTVSMRGPEGRLTWVGLSATSPLLPPLLSAVRVDGPGFVASDGLSEQMRDTMRDDLVAWLRTLSPPPSGDTRRAPKPEALQAALRQHGYWDAAPTQGSSTGPAAPQGPPPTGASAIPGPPATPGPSTPQGPPLPPPGGAR